MLVLSIRILTLIFNSLSLASKQDTNILGFKGPRNMTVLLPGMTEDDQRVKISSCDPSQQGLLDSWKTKV